MGREIKRVPLDFIFPLDASYHDAAWEQHKATCPHADDEDYDHDKNTCGGFSWSPPTGEGWQLWQTVSDGPISPVFATPEELIDWMSQPVPADKRKPYEPAAYPARPWAQGWQRESAERFVRGEGWMPSAMFIDGELLGPNEMAKRGVK
jgi:hypothetical protein